MKSGEKSPKVINIDSFQRSVFFARAKIDKNPDSYNKHGPIKRKSGKKKDSQESNDENVVKNKIKQASKLSEGNIMEKTMISDTQVIDLLSDNNLKQNKDDEVDDNNQITKSNDLVITKPTESEKLDVSPSSQAPKQKRQKHGSKDLYDETLLLPSNRRKTSNSCDENNFVSHEAEAKSQKLNMKSIINNDNDTFVSNCYNSELQQLAEKLACGAEDCSVSPQHNKMAYGSSRYQKFPETGKTSLSIGTHNDVNVYDAHVKLHVENMKNEVEAKNTEYPLPNSSISKNSSVSHEMISHDIMSPPCIHEQAQLDSSATTNGSSEYSMYQPSNDNSRNIAKVKIGHVDGAATAQDWFIKRMQDREKCKEFSLSDQEIKAPDSVPFNKDERFSGPKDKAGQRMQTIPTFKELDQSQNNNLITIPKFSQFSCPSSFQVCMVIIYNLLLLYYGFELNHNSFINNIIIIL